MHIPSLVLFGFIVCILSNTANQIVDELEDLDRLFVIYHDKSMINHHNRLLRELKQIRMHLNGY